MPGESLSSARARVQARLARAVERGTTQAEAARHRWALVDVAFATHERDRRAVGGVLAGAVAFRLFVYLLPLFLAVVTLLGVVIGLDDDAPDSLGNRLGMSRYVVDSVRTAARESNRSLWLLVPLTLWAVYWAGVGAVKVMWAIHTVAWGLPMRRVPRGLLAAVAAFGLVVATGLTVVGLQAVRQESELAGIVVLALQLAVLVGLWLAASRLLPHDPAAGWLDLLPGALLVGLGVWGLHVVSAYLLAHQVASASELYGSLGVAAALLAWLYILGRLMVASAMLNSTLWERGRASRPDR